MSSALGRGKHHEVPAAPGSSYSYQRKYSRHIFSIDSDGSGAVGRGDMGKWLYEG